MTPQIMMSERLMKPLRLLEYIHSLEDNQFDLVYPRGVRNLSPVHWTPVTVARRAAAFLVREPNTRVLDIGCGPGKFCIVGALTTGGQFTGVEQRKDLCDLAQTTIHQANIPNAKVFSGNIAEVDFSGFDAFYLFNPFEENLETELRIDDSVHFSINLYSRYTQHVAEQLAMAPLGTRVATYCGVYQEVPMGYECLENSMDSRLKFWEKTKHERMVAKPPEAPVTGSKGRFMSRSFDTDERGDWDGAD